MVTKNVQKAGKAYFVYLPKKWVEKAGKEVHLREDERGNLVLSSIASKKPLLEKAVSVKECSDRMLRRIIIGSYVLGYDKVTIEFEKKKTQQDILRYMDFLEEGGLGLGLLDVKPHRVSFFVNQRLSPLFLTVKRFFEAVLNSARAIGDDVRLAKRFERESLNLKLNLLRSANVVVRDSSLAEEGVDPVLYLHFSEITLFLTVINKFLFEKEGRVDLETYKKLIEIMLLILKKPTLSDLNRYDELLLSLKDKRIWDRFSKIHRHIINYYLLTG